MQIMETKHEAVLVLAPVGRIDSATSTALERALQGAIERGDRRLVVDFEGVEYISSAGLRVLLVAARRLKDAKGSWAFCSLADAVREVFDLAGFLTLFNVEPTRLAAIGRVETLV